MPWRYALALFMTVLSAPAWAQDRATQEACLRETLRQERENGLPPNLLTALSLVESGRWDPQRQAGFAWPWTVNAGSVGKFFPSKEEAIAEVQRLRAEGVRNIDVGCMQINLRAHPNAFETLDAALDPRTNVAYAVAFVKRLYEEHGDWEQAATRYHSNTEVYRAKYAGKLRATLARLSDKGVPAIDDRIQIPPHPMVAAVDLEAPKRLLKERLEAERAKRLAAAAEPRAWPRMPTPVIRDAAWDRRRVDARAEAEAWRAEKLQAFFERRAGKPAHLIGG